MNTDPLGPLNVAPVGIRPPFDQRPPRQPYDQDVERWRAARIADKAAAITEALDGVDLGSYDRTMIEWLAGWDEPTVGTLVSLLYRAREAEARRQPNSDI